MSTSFYPFYVIHFSKKYRALSVFTKNKPKSLETDVYLLLANEEGVGMNRELRSVLAEDCEYIGLVEACLMCGSPKSSSGEGEAEE